MRIDKVPKENMKAPHLCRNSRKSFWPFSFFYDSNILLRNCMPLPAADGKSDARFDRIYSSVGNKNGDKHRGNFHEEFMIGTGNYV